MLCHSGCWLNRSGPVVDRLRAQIYGFANAQGDRSPFAGLHNDTAWIALGNARSPVRRRCVIGVGQSIQPDRILSARSPHDPVDRQGGALYGVHLFCIGVALAFQGGSLRWREEQSPERVAIGTNRARAAKNQGGGDP
jgi:hypothetical protein